jgi:hypothetical protein
MLGTINWEPLVFCMWHYACKKHKTYVKGPSIGMLFVCCGTAHVKSIRQMLRDHQSGTPWFLYVALRM